MLIKIREDVFTGSDFKGLNYLIQILTYKQRYDLFVEWTLIRDTDYYQKLDHDDRIEIEENYNRSVTESLTPKYFITNTSNHDAEFNLEEAIRFFIQPVSIILENSLNDQYFIKAIIKFFARTSEVQRQLDNGWIQFENAGGCSNVENFINGKLQSFNNLSKDNCSFLRCLVVLDSDKEFPTAPIKPAYTSLIEFFHENKILYHLLYKRSMENYMPVEVFPHISDTVELSAWTAAYSYLTDEQRDYINISGGFAKKDCTGNPNKTRLQLEPEVQNLFTNLSQSNYDILDKGFKLSNFKSNFPQHFEHHQVHKSTLQSRCNSLEFLEIIDKITTFL